MIQINISGREIKGAQCSFTKSMTRRSISRAQKNLFFQVDSWQLRRPLKKRKMAEHQNSFFRQCEGLLPSTPVSVKEYLRDLFDIHGPLPRRPIAITL